MDHELPPKTCSVERLVTQPADVQKVLDGVKTATRRNGRYADPGEVMTISSRRFVVDRVYVQTIGEMTDTDARAEGFADLASYNAYILSMHAGMRLTPQMKVWVHEFRALAD